MVLRSSQHTRFVYDGDALVAEYDNAGNLVLRYVHGPGVDNPLVWFEGAATVASTARYYHTDHQGSVIAVSDAAGNAGFRTTVVLFVSAISC